MWSSASSQSAAVVKPGRSALDQKIGDYFASCMDTATIDKKGIAPIKRELDRIQAMSDEPDVVAEIAHLHRLGVGVLFGFGAAPDAKDSNRTIATLRQGGLSLPDREYYLKTDAKSVEIRQRFEQHVKNMFQLAGDPADTAASKARMVLEMETILAKASMDRVSLRDPDKTYHIVTRQQLAALSAGFDWNSYLKAVGAPAFETLNVAQPDFLKQIAATLPSQPITAFQAYFSYHLLRAAAAELPEAFENESFDFWQRYLSGVKEPRPRANRCAAMVDRALGDLLGQKYVETAFGADAKAQITQLVEALDKALEKDIQTLPWMTEATKKAAIVKLHAITNNVGYPKKWRDYSKVSIVRDDLLRQFGARRGSHVRPAHREDRPAHRQDRVVHDHPHRQRLLQRAEQQHQLPGRHSATAVLRSPARYRHELRRHRRGDRPRNDSRFRRPGPQVRRRRQPARLVDAPRRRRVREARRLHRR